MTAMFFFDVAFSLMSTAAGWGSVLTCYYIEPGKIGKNKLSGFAID